MKERPILMSGPMIRALLSGSKTQTRRVIKPQPTVCPDNPMYLDWNDSTLDVLAMARYCPYGQPGDRLWCKEQYLAEVPGDAAWEVEGLSPGNWMPRIIEEAIVHYRASSTLGDGWKWRPSIHMPRWASRITLEVVSVRVERVQDISDYDALAEGVRCPVCGYTIRDEWTHMDHYICSQKQRSSMPDIQTSAVLEFSSLWDSINAKRGFGWDANPWVWVVDFKVVSQ